MAEEYEPNLVRLREAVNDFLDGRDADEALAEPGPRYTMDEMRERLGLVGPERADLERQAAGPLPAADYETFVKHDGGKTRVELIEPDFLRNLGHVLRFGADKYGEDNWKRGIADYEAARLRVLGALGRHWLDLLSGRTNDYESRQHIAGHIAACAMFVQWLDENIVAHREEG